MTVIACGLLWPQPAPGALAADSSEARTSAAHQPTEARPDTVAVHRIRDAPSASAWQRLLDEMEQLARSGLSAGHERRLRESVTGGIRAVDRSACHPLGQRRLREVTRRMLGYVEREVATLPFWIDQLLAGDLLRTTDEPTVERIARNASWRHASEVARVLAWAWSRQLADGRVRRTQRLAASRLLQVSGSPAERRAAEQWLAGSSRGSGSPSTDLGRR